MWSSSSVMKNSVRHGVSSRRARVMRIAATRPPVVAVVSTELGYSTQRASLIGLRPSPVPAKPAQ